MSEPLENDPSNLPQTNSEVLGAIQKIQQQLVFLEKKIDTLLAQSSEKSFHRPRHFSKPFRPGGSGHSFPRGPGERGNHPRERSFSEGRPFDKPQGSENRGFSRGRKAFFRRQKNRG